MERSVNLLCLPFAGGNKYSYRAYEVLAPASLNLVTVDYPGRGARITAPLMGNMEELVEDAYNQVGRIISQKDYAVYGHSMGGIVAFLLVRKIISRGEPAPRHLFITGTTAPSSGERQQRHLLDKAEFIEEIRTLGGMPEEILQNKELLEYIEPILRADFKAVETYRYKDDAPLNVPVTVITGTDEKTREEDIRAWQQMTSLKADIRKMPGKHFFIFDNATEIMEIIVEKVSNTINIF